MIRQYSSSALSGMRVFGTVLFRRATNANVGDIAFGVDEVTANVHRRRFCPLPVVGTMLDAMNRGTGGCRRLGEQLDETCDQIHASPRNRKPLAGHSGKQAEPDLIQPFTSVAPSKLDARSV